MNNMNFAWPVTAISKADYDVIVNWADSIRALLEKKELLIFGAGIRGAEIAVILGTVGIKNIIFTDNNTEKWGGYIDNHPIIPVAEALRNKDRYVFLVSVEEGDGICKQLEQNEMIRDVDYFFPKSNLYEIFLKEYNRPLENGILFLGDCMFEVIAFDDEDKTSISEMLYQHLGDGIKCLTMHGLSAPGFLHMVRGQINSEMVPRCIVMMMNFETLTGKQHLLPRSQHSFLIRSTCETTPDPDGKMAEYLKVVEERVNNINAEFFTTSKFSSNSNNNVGRISDAAAKVFFKLNYLYSLDTETESIECIRSIMRISKEHSIEVIPFVPPVNYERGIELFGQEIFETKYNDNLNKLKTVISEEGFDLLDLSHICSKEEFAHVTTPDETTNYIGRMHVVNEIIRELKRKKIV